MIKKRYFKLFITVLLLISQGLLSQGYIYVHKKAASELGSPTFNFQMSPSASGLSTFSLNDTPDALNVTDLGASHGDGAGQLWAVANTTSFAATPRQNGSIYTRKPGQSQWTQVTALTNVRSIDGIGLDSAVFTDSNGHIFLLKNGATTQLYNNTSGINASATAFAVDVASDGTETGIYAVIGAGNSTSITLPVAMQNRQLYKYSNSGTSISNWSPYTNAGNKVYRLDVNPSTKEVYFINFSTDGQRDASGNPIVVGDVDLNIYKMSNASPSLSTRTTVPAPSGAIFVQGSSGASYNNRRDIAVTDTGTIYSIFSYSGAPSDAQYIFEYYGGSWHFNEQSRNFAVPTAGPNGQVWAASKANAGLVEHAIFTRASDGSWLDDERVRPALIGNSILIPVQAGTYSIKEILDPNYKLSEISIIDPSNNSNYNIGTSTANINVSNDEVVHVTFQNTKINSVAVPNNCNENVLMDFGSGSDRFGPPLDGITAYHYKKTGINGNDNASAGDGYYLLAKTSTDFFGGLNPNITNHTPGQSDGYFGIFNASYAKDDFFRRTLTNMVVGTKYRLSFWAANLSPTNDLKPNAIMEIVDANGVSMGKVETGDITATNWKVYTFTFTATSSIGEIFLRNNGVGGSGNDIAIDDVTISASPVEIPPIDGPLQICTSSGALSAQFTNPTTGGVWSSDNTTLLTINPTTGLATAVNGALGIVNITYTFTSSTGCVSHQFIQVKLTNDCKLGYLYVHKKAVSESTSVDFDFGLYSQNGSLVKTFQLNDKPNSIGNSFDIGNSHDNGEGQLWTVVNTTANNQGVHNTAGFLYTRKVNSSQWTLVSPSITNAISVDGIDADRAVYSDEAGDVFIVTGATSAKIWNALTHTTKIVDVASAGTNKAIVVVDNTGAIFKYNGNGTTDVWTKFANVTPSSTQKANRLDINPATGEVVFIRTGGDLNVYRVASANPATATVSIFSAPPTTFISNPGTTPDESRDVAISNDGTVYTSYQQYIYWKKQTDADWTSSLMTRRLYGYTGGTQDMAWSINKNNSDLIEQSIYAKARTLNTSGQPVWLDDERIRTSDLGNSIMIPVPVGTYFVREGVNPQWNNNEINIYDPTGDSTVSNFANNESKVMVAENEVVNVVYSNTIKNAINIPNTCATNYVVTFGGNTSSSAFSSTPISGFTSYHFRAGNRAADGYYIITKDNTGWWDYPAHNILLKDHSVTSTGAPANGYYAIFNASYAKEDFFRQTVTGLVVGVKYELAFWVADVGPTYEIRPNVTMGIVDPATGIEMGTPIDTGNIHATQWKRYSAQFVATATTAEIYLRNNAIGGRGNDIAIDDISFQPAPDPLNPIQTPPGFTKICSSGTTLETYQFSIVPPTTAGTGIWTTDNTNLITINPTTGIATAKALGISGTAEIIYRFTSSSGCLSEAKLVVDIGVCACYNPANTSGTANPTKHGITLLKRAGTDNGGWPMNRPSAHTVLESNSQGFVPTRVPTSGLGSITTPQEGMMVYDTTAKCLKIYSDGAWKCFNVPACP